MMNPETKTLPDDVEVDILVRLPVKSILRFKSVCKRWHSLTADPSFISRYNCLSESSSSSSSSSSSPSSCRRCKLLCYGQEPITNPRVVLSTPILDDHHHQVQLQPKELTKEHYLGLPPFIDDNRWVFEGANMDHLYPNCNESEIHRIVSDIHIVGHVNGIYCIFHRLISASGGTLILWNPAARSYKHILPPISFPLPLHLHRWFTPRNDDEVGQPNGLHFGFGYDNSINDYKVVVIYHWHMTYNFPPDEHWYVRVYNNATESWTTVCRLEYTARSQSAFPYIICNPEFCNNFLNGACHWPCAKREGDFNRVSEYGVLVFNMVDHSFRIMGGLPIPIDKVNPYNKVTKMSLWVIRGTIAVAAIPPEKKESIEIWIMKEYGVEDSWDLLGSIATQKLDPEFGVIGIPNDEWIFLGDDKGRLISYRIHEDHVEDDGVQIRPLDSHRGAYRGTVGVFNYMESLSPIVLQPITQNNCTCKFRLHLFDW